MNANLLLLVHEEKLASCSSWLQSKEMIMSNNKTGARFSFPFLTARDTRKRGSKKFFFMKSRKTIILLPCIATISKFLLLRGLKIISSLLLFCIEWHLHAWISIIIFRCAVYNSQKWAFVCQLLHPNLRHRLPYCPLYFLYFHKLCNVIR